MTMLTGIADLVFTIEYRMIFFFCLSFACSGSSTNRKQKLHSPSQTTCITIAHLHFSILQKLLGGNRLVMMYLQWKQSGHFWPICFKFSTDRHFPNCQSVTMMTWQNSLTPRQLHFHRILKKSLLMSFTVHLASLRVSLLDLFSGSMVAPLSLLSCCIVPALPLRMMSSCLWKEFISILVNILYLRLTTFLSNCKR